MLSLLFEIAKWISLIFVIFLFSVVVVLRIIRHYIHFPIPSFATRLIDNPIRRRFVQRPDTISNRMQLEPGMIVVEIGPGTGTYTKAVAERIMPNGKVFAVDIQESVIRRLKEQIERNKIANIFPKIDDAHNFSFPDESVDRVLAIATLPEIPNPVQVLRECHRILRPNGLVSLCELIIDPDYPRRNTEKKWAQEAGFKLENEFGNFVSYQLNFKKT